MPRSGPEDEKADERRVVAGRLLDVLGRTSARVKTIVTVRTEFFAQVQDVMHDPSARQAWQDHYLPELDDQALSDILVAPTAGEPIAYADQAPAAAYELGYEPGVLDALLGRIKKAATSGRFGRLPLVQTVGAELVELSRRRGLLAVRSKDVKKLRIEQAFSDLVNRRTRSAVAGTSRAVNALFERLMVRHDNGVSTRNLLSIRSIQEKSPGSRTARKVVDDLGDAGLLDRQMMVQDGVESLHVGPPQDSFELLEGGRETGITKRKYARSKVLDALFIMVPLAVLGIALTRYLTVLQYQKELGLAKKNNDQLGDFVKDMARSMRMMRLSAYHGMIARADEALRRGDTLQARQLLLSALPDPESGVPVELEPRESDLRGFEWFLLWRKSQMETKNLQGHTAGVRTLALAPAAEDLLASGDELGTVHLWNFKKGGELGAVLLGLKRPVQALAFSADGAWVAGCDDGGSAFVWPTTIGTDRPTDSVPKSVIAVKNARGVAFVAPGVLAVAAADGIRLWDVADSKEKTTLKDLGAPVVGLVALGDGKMAAASAEQAIVWNADGKKESATKIKGTTIHAIAAAKSGLLIAGDGAVHLWDLKDGSTPAVKARQPGTVRAIASLGDDRIATGGDDMTIRLHDLAAGTEVGRLYGHLSRVRSLVADKAGRLVSACSDPTIKTWSTGLASPIRESVPAHDSVLALALDPLGQVLASGGHDGLIKLWSTLTTEKTGEIKAGAPVHALAFSTTIEGKSIVLAAGVDNDVRRWSLSAGKEGFDVKELPALKKHADRVLCLRLLGRRQIARVGEPRQVGDHLGRRFRQAAARPAEPDGRHRARVPVPAPHRRRHGRQPAPLGCR